MFKHVFKGLALSFNNMFILFEWFLKSLLKKRNKINIKPTKKRPIKKIGVLKNIQINDFV